mmetsp:Transcript_26704/g.92770  ORF Transcript_26704/g.92770 Transcript_26704/m.92770 type:complete len:234 (+) Transcript_26704:1182-1883(+)
MATTRASRITSSTASLSFIPASTYAAMNRTARASISGSRTRAASCVASIHACTAAASVTSPLKRSTGFAFAAACDPNPPSSLPAVSRRSSPAPKPASPPEPAPSSTNGTRCAATSVAVDAPPRGASRHADGTSAQATDTNPTLGAFFSSFATPRAAASSSSRPPSPAPCSTTKTVLLSSKTAASKSAALPTAASVGLTTSVSVPEHWRFAKPPHRLRIGHQPWPAARQLEQSS